MQLPDLVSIGVAFVGVLLSAYFFFRSRRLKRIQVSHVNYTSVLEVKEPIPKLRILHGDREVQELWILQFKVNNSGTLDIDQEDLKGTPIQCRTSAEVVDARIIERSPENLHFDIDQCSGDQVIFKTPLLKRRESATVKLTLLSKPQVDFSDTRIPNVRPIDIIRPTRLNRRVFFTSVGVSTLAVLAGIIYFSVYGVGTRWPDFRLECLVDPALVPELGRLRWKGVKDFPVRCSFAASTALTVDSGFIESKGNGTFVEAYTPLGSELRDPSRIELAPFQLESNVPKELTFLMDGPDPGRIKMSIRNGNRSAIFEVMVKPYGQPP